MQEPRHTSMDTSALAAPAEGFTSGRSVSRREVLGWGALGLAAGLFSALGPRTSSVLAQEEVPNPLAAQPATAKEKQEVLAIVDRIIADLRQKGGDSNSYLDAALAFKAATQRNLNILSSPRVSLSRHYGGRHS